MQTFIHYFLHFGLPFFIAYLFFEKEWKTTYLLLLSTMLIDLDHLLATPIFDATRCSIGFHPLHSIYAAIVYLILLFFPKPYRILGLGLILHLLTDLIDCIFTYHKCQSCFENTPALNIVKNIYEALGF